nr:unnamed protein product [Digitaria exilis]
MAAAKTLAPVLIFTAVCCYAIILSHASPDADFNQCLSASIPSQLVHAQNSSSFTPLLVSSIRNPLFATPTTIRPLWIITPTNASHVQATVVCGHRHGVRLRVRSGGHDYEGLSYRSVLPEAFAVVDLSKLRTIHAGKVWGEKYFRDNYRRLAAAKDEIDPDDYFRNEQSIPPLGLGNNK